MDAPCGPLVLFIPSPDVRLSVATTSPIALELQERVDVNNAASAACFKKLPDISRFFVLVDALLKNAIRKEKC